MPRALAVIIITLSLASCASTASTRGTYKHIGGRVPDEQFRMDSAVCRGEAEKANLSAGTNNAPGMWGAAEAQRRGSAVEAVMDGCMAGKGYVFVPSS